jgi:hypothetical protein
MSGNATVQVEVLALVADFKAQMASAAVAMNQAVKKMGGDLGELGHGARKAGDNVVSLSGWLKEHRREMRAEAGMTKVLARDMAALGVGAEGAGGAIAHLVGAFAIGGGVGVAIAAVKLIAEAFRKLGEEEEKAREALSKWFDEMDKKHAKSLREIQDIEDKVAGLRPEQIYAREQQAVLAQVSVLQARITAEEREQERLSENILADKKKTADAITRGSSLRMEDVGVVDADKIAKSKREVASLQSQIAALNRDAEDYAKKASGVVSLGAKDYNTKRDEDARKAREQARKDELAGMSEEEARQAKKVADYLAGEAQYAQQAAQIRSHWAKVGATEEEKAYLDMQEAMKNLRENDQASRDEVWAGYIRRTEEMRLKRKADLVTEQLDIQKWSQDIGRSFGRLFSDSLLHAKSFADGMTAMFASMADAIIEQLARIAAAEAATFAIKGILSLFSGGITAGIGGSFLQSQVDIADLEGAIGGRAGGGPVSAWTPYMVGERGRELFVPQTPGTIVPNGALAGVGGMNVSLTVNAIDARSFDGYLRSGGDSVILRALSRARAQGRS